jgi:CheY-like chemotaxis protein
MANNSAGRVLVVDDDPDVRNFLSESLAGLGYLGIMKEDGLGALGEMKRVKPDVMIVDFAMPGINGAEVARRARAIHPNLPIIFASGYAESAAVHEVMDENSRLLQKPFSIGDLQFSLHQLLVEPTNYYPKKGFPRTIAGQTRVRTPGTKKGRVEPSHP